MSPLRFAVVIPCLNESASIARAIRSAHAAGANTVVVSDGGSVDATVDIARQEGAEVVRGASIRGDQCNLGAARAEGDVICFLHADSMLPAIARDDISRVIDAGYRCGGFKLKFEELSRGLRLTSALINLRSRLTGLIWGDQAQFFESGFFEELGRYRPLPIMEDYEMILRARARSKPALIESPVVTSGRRFIRNGVIRTTITNWQTIAMYHAGVSPERLAARYRR